MIAGTLEILMMADLARIKKDMDDAKGVVSSAAGIMGKALGAIGAGLSIAGITAWIKGGIDAADAAFQISQKTGLATKEVAGLQLAFQLGTGSSDGMTTALAKMAKQAVEGNAAFRALGVETRNADGSMKSTKDILYATADAFAGIKDGAAKTSLAMEIFGKSGADLIPMLNGGADGLRNMADMAAKLGLVIDDETAAAADAFNDTLDTLGNATKGMATQVAASLLPTLSALAGGFLETVTEGDGLRKVAEFISSALKILYTVIAGGIQVVATLGNGFGALGAAIAAVVTGDFGRAKTVIGEFMGEAKRDWTATIANIGKVWDGTAGKTAQAANTMTRALRTVTPATQDQDAASRKAADAASKLADEQRKLTQAGVDYYRELRRNNDELQNAIDTGRELTEADKENLKLTKELAEGKKVMTREMEALTRAEIQRRQGLREEQQWLRDTEKANGDFFEALRKTTDQLRDQTEKQREANETVGLSARALAEREAAMLRDDAAAKERLATEAELVDWTGKTSEEYRKQAKLLRERADMAEQGVAVREAQQAAAEWQKTTDQIGQGLTDSLYRAFESGKDFFSTLWDGIKNTIKTTALRLVVDVAMKPVNAVLGSVLGGASGLAQAGTGGGMLGNLGGLGSMMGTLGGGLSAGFGALFGEGGIMGALDAAGIAMGAGNVAGGLGTALGALAPVAAGIGLIASLAKSLDKSGTPHMGSVVTADASGARTGGADPTRILDNFRAETDTALKGLAGGVVGLLNLLSGSNDFSAQAKFSADNTDPSFGDFVLARGGSTVGDILGGEGDGAKAYAKDAAKGFEQFAADVGGVVRQAIDAIDLPQWASDALAALGDSPGLDKLTEAAQAIAATREALEHLTETLTPLGGVFAKVAGLSGDAQLQLANFAGGIDAFLQKTSAYVQQYYSEEERFAIAAAGIVESLQAVGIEAGGATRKGQLREVMDSLDPTSEIGRRQMAALLDVAAQYAPIGDFLEKTGMTLGELAQRMPSSTGLEALESAQEDANVAAQATATNTDEIADNTASTTEAVSGLNETTEAQTAAMVAGIKQMLELLAKMDASLQRLGSDARMTEAAPT